MSRRSKLLLGPLPPRPEETAESPPKLSSHGSSSVPASFEASTLCSDGGETREEADAPCNRWAAGVSSFCSGSAGETVRPAVGDDLSGVPIKAWRPLRTGLTRSADVGASADAGEGKSREPASALPAGTACLCVPIRSFASCGTVSLKAVSMRIVHASHTRLCAFALADLTLHKVAESVVDQKRKSICRLSAVEQKMHTLARVCIFCSTSSYLA